MHNLIAFFVKGIWSLNIEPPSGNGTTTPPTGIYTLTTGSSQSVKANPANGWVFDHWLLDGEVKKENPISVSE